MLIYSCTHAQWVYCARTHTHPHPHTHFLRESRHIHTHARTHARARTYAYSARRQYAEQKGQNELYQTMYTPRSRDIGNARTRTRKRTDARAPSTRARTPRGFLKHEHQLKMYVRLRARARVLHITHKHQPAPLSATQHEAFR